MEYWELKTDDGLILFTDACHPYKNRSRSIKRGSSAFSPRRRLHRLYEPEANIPVFHHSMAYVHGTANFR